MKQTLPKVFNILILFYLAPAIECVAKNDHQLNEQDTTTANKEYPYVLPIWEQKVADRGIDMQLPFGLNVNYVYQLTLELTQFSMNFFDSENLDMFRSDKVENKTYHYSSEYYYGR